MPPRAAVLGRLLGVGLLVAWIGVLLGAGGLVFTPVPKVRRRFRIWLFQAGPRWILGWLRTDVDVAGPLPSPPFLLVANHLSYLDVLVLASRLPRIQAQVCFCDAPISGDDRKRLAEELRAAVLGKQSFLSSGHAGSTIQ